MMFYYDTDYPFTIFCLMRSSLRDRFCNAELQSACFTQQQSMLYNRTEPHENADIVLEPQYVSKSYKHRYTKMNPSYTENDTYFR
jgi:hypothetical protein